MEPQIKEVMEQPAEAVEPSEAANPSEVEKDGAAAEDPGAAHEEAKAGAMRSIFGDSDSEDEGEKAPVPQTMEDKRAALAKLASKAREQKVPQETRGHGLGPAKAANSFSLLVSPLGVIRFVYFHIRCPRRVSLCVSCLSYSLILRS